MRWLTLLLFALLPAAGQELRVYSEFRRVDAKGEVVAADRGGTPREILSPALPRNAFSSFRMVILLPPGSDVWLEVGQNPEGAVGVTIYEEAADGRLREVSQPYRTKLAPGTGVMTLWMDLWVKREAAVERIKVEPQLYFEGRWYTYPMEARIIAPVAPAIRGSAVASPPPNAAADFAAAAVLRERLCGVKAAGRGAQGPSIWSLSRRNALQDVAIAGAQLGPAVLKATGAATVASWCKAPPAKPQGPEWYLRVRDAIYRGVRAE